MNNRPPLERMMKIAAKLREGRRFNYRTLAEELEVCRKTVERDVNFMRDRLNYEIEWKAEFGTPMHEWTFVGRPPKERVL